MRWILILLMAVLLVSCGDSDDSNNDVNPGGDVDPVPTSAPDDTEESEGSDDSGNGGDESAAAGETSVAFSGAHSGEITDTGSCSEGPSGDGFQLFASHYDDTEDLTWMLQIRISEYDGAGQYEVGDSLLAGDGVSFDDTSVTFGNNGGDEFGSTGANGGSVVVDDGELSGSIDATLVSEDGSSEVSLTGTWTCTR